MNAVGVAISDRQSTCDNKIKCEFCQISSGEFNWTLTDIYHNASFLNLINCLIISKLYQSCFFFFTSPIPLARLLGILLVLCGWTGKNSLPLSACVSLIPLARVFWEFYWFYVIGLSNLGGPNTVHFFVPFFFSSEISNMNVNLAIFENNYVNFLF